MEEYLNLPQGSLLNLQPRPRHGRQGNTDLKEARRNSSPRPNPGIVSFDDENRAAVDESENKEDLVPAPLTPSLHRAKATKLPMSKALTDKAKDRRKTKPVESGEEEQKDSSPAPLKVSSSPGESRPSATTPPTDKDREQYRQKIREMFDKANNNSAHGSPKGNGKDKQKGHYQEAYRKILSLANSSKHEITRQKLKYAGGPTQILKSPPRSGVPRPKVSSPKPGTQQDSVFASRNVPPALAPGRTNALPKRDRSLNLETQESVPPKSSDRTDTTDSSVHSYPSISPVSGPSTSITEWEDRFVVHMPSAREPNPPTMNAHQITEFQKSIEMVHKEGGAMLDPDTLPSPRTRTPEDHNDTPDHHGKPGGASENQDLQPAVAGEGADVSLENQDRRYYSPEEIGKQRFSTIWEESPGKPKRQNSDINPDGSFLGCKEINGPQDKNPDEILLFSSFSSPMERPRLVDVAPPVKAKQWKNPTTSEAKAPEPPKATSTLQDEWRPISQNLKNALCSRPSPRTLCQETKCQETKCQETKNQPSETAAVPTTTPHTANPQEKENTSAGGGLVRRRPVQKAKRGDDLFIITPTITRTLVNMEDKNGTTRKSSGTPEAPMTSKPAVNRGDTATDTRAKGPIASTPSGLRRATQHSWTKSNTPSRPLPILPTETTATKQENERPALERSRAIRGFIRMPGMVKSSTENFGGRPRNNSEHHIPPPPPIPRDETKVRPARSKSDTPRCVSPVKPVTAERPEYASSIRSARIYEVAELDGLQLGDPKDPRKDNETRNDTFEGRRSSVKNGTLTARTNVRLRPVSTASSEPRQVLNPLTWGLIMDILALSAAQAQSIYSQIVTDRKSRMDLAKTCLHCISGMVGHCLYVVRDILTALSVYNTTGTWPKDEKRDLLRFLSDFGQAVVYFVALGFMMMVVGRAAGYVVLIGSWIVWFTKPFGWVLGSLARVVLT